jgi:hypothetical protein
MAEVPKIVRERLSYQAVGEHPDANLLSAFAEHALTDPEREQVLDHLSRCADCRQILALAAPEEAAERLATAALAPAGAKPSWWRSPILHWGAFTAAALVMLIAVGARMRLREGRSASAPAVATSSANEVAQKSAIPAPEVPPAPAQPKQFSKKLAKLPEPPPQAPARSAGKPDDMVSRIIGGSAGGVGTGSGGGIGSGSGMQSGPAPPPPPVLGGPLGKMQAKAADAGVVSSNIRVEKSRQKAPPPPSAASETAIVAGAPPALKREGAMLSSQNAVLAARKAISARWSVSDSGALQRSFDGGRSWHEVAVGDGVTFRAVATVGSDVWAGGSGGALFHSADGGEHWSQVLVQAKDRAPSGDIVRIEFTDAQNGIITTSEGETWTTSNSGNTWQRR